MRYSAAMTRTMAGTTTPMHRRSRQRMALMTVTALPRIDKPHCGARVRTSDLAASMASYNWHFVYAHLMHSSTLAPMHRRQKGAKSPICNL